MKGFLFSAVLLAVALAACGCHDAPGKPATGDEAPRPEMVMDAPTLYAENCAACHGPQGRNGAAIALANPVYLAAAGSANIQRATAQGVPGTAMPAFARSAGGMLTDEQIAALVKGMIGAWGNASALGGQTPPAYLAILQGDAEAGHQAFNTYCARCHGFDGEGMATNTTRMGPLVDPSYLALVSNQGLRSMVIAGKPAEGMPDWRGHLGGGSPHALTDQEITNIVAWLAAHRTNAPGQPYRK